MSNPMPNHDHSHEHVRSGITHGGRAFPKYEVQNDQFVKIYVWELPVRIFHWVNALAIFVLMVTGIYIGKPFVSAMIQEDAYYSWFMNWNRYIHFFFGFVFIANLIFRWYWVYRGNKFASSNIFQLAFWKEMIETMKYYGLIKHKKPHYVGHNPLAQMSYWVFCGLGSVVMVFTGMYMYVEPQHESLFGKAFMWVPWIMGGDSYDVRSLHHLVAWGFMMFTVTHVYMAFREDWLERNGTMSSIITGWKKESVHVLEEEHNDKK